VPRFTRAQLESFRDAEVPDLLGPDVRLLFVGINPGLWTAATQTHFAHPVNRFYPALLRAGILTEPVDQASGMTDADRDLLRSRGIGITNLARRATARASELTAEELREGGRRLEELIGVRRRAWSPSPASRRTAPPSAGRAPCSDPSPRPSAAPSCGWCPTRAG
jgi:TDG/mug DNA glycosylase family protein